VNSSPSRFEILVVAGVSVAFVLAIAAFVLRHSAI